MPLTPNFSSTESLSSNNLVTFFDTSTGTDLTITTRRIYVKLANGNWLTTSGESTTVAYESWSYALSSIQLDLLDNSTTANVTVEWYAGAVLTYTKTILMEWDLYDYVFAFGLIQDQTASPGIIQDQNYYSNFFLFITNIWCSESAVTYGSDLYSSQSALNVNLNMITNSNDFF